MAKTGRTEANSLAGEEIVFKNEKSKVDEVEGMVAPSKKVIAPLFNIVSPVVCCMSGNSHMMSRRMTRK